MTTVRHTTVATALDTHPTSLVTVTSAVFTDVARSAGDASTDPGSSHGIGSERRVSGERGVGSQRRVSGERGVGSQRRVSGERGVGSQRRAPAARGASREVWQ